MYLVPSVRKLDRLGNTVSKANSSYQEILLHNQLCSFKFPIVLCELCFVLHFHSFIVPLAVLFVDLVHCILLFFIAIL